MTLSGFWEKIGTPVLLALFLTAQLCFCQWLHFSTAADAPLSPDFAIAACEVENTDRHGETPHILHSVKQKLLLPVSFEIAMAPITSKNVEIPHAKSLEKNSDIPYIFLPRHQRQERILSCFRS